MKRLFLAVVAVVICCRPEAISAATITIRMSSFSFTPAVTNIGVGDTVIWTNLSTGLGSTHTSTRGDATCGTNGFGTTFWESGNIASHAVYTKTFTNYAPGTYTYVCTIHCAAPQNMRGTLIITNPPNVPPTVLITNPPNAATFNAPANVTIQATASDTAGGSVTNVQFLVGGIVLTNDTSVPYSATTSGLSAGNYTLTAIASDNDGAKATNSVSITVNAPPTVTITNPANGAVFSPPANITIGADATDSGSGTITNVQFLVSGTVIANDTTVPYSATTNGLPAGGYTLTAIASDNDGAKATNSVSITVNAPPTVTITNPANDAVFSPPANITIGADAMDPDGGTITNVQFLVGGTVIANDTTVPYSATTNGLPAGGYTLTAIASDNNGATATNAIGITVNSAPTISITNPAAAAKFLAPAIITLGADANDSDGNVTNVQFFSGNSALASVNNPPFSYAVSNLPAGNYSFSAAAFDNFGAGATSPAVSVFILTNPILSVPIRTPDGQFRFTITGIAGQTYASEFSTNLNNWTSFATNIAPANNFNVTDFTSSNILNNYYRARQDLN